MKSLRQLLRLPSTSSTPTQQHFINSDPSTLLKVYFPFTTSFFGESMLQQIEIEKKMKSTLNLLKNDHSGLLQPDFYPFMKKEELVKGAATATTEEIAKEENEENEQEEEEFTSPSTILHAYFTLPFHTMESCGIHAKEIFATIETLKGLHVKGILDPMNVQDEVIMEWNKEEEEGYNNKEILATSTLRKRRTKMNQHKYKKRMKAIRKRTKEKMN